MTKQPNSKTKTATAHKLIASNPSAKSNYFIEEVVEAGLVLLGTEVKSLRAQSPNLRDAFVDLSRSGQRFEAWLNNATIPPYSHGTAWNHAADRRRKLLLHQKQLEKMFGEIHKKGMAIVPTKLYFSKGIVKIELGIGRGKKKHDKRDSEKKRSADREMASAKRRDR